MTDSIAAPIRHILAGQRNTTVLMAEVEEKVKGILGIRAATPEEEAATEE